MPLLPLVTKQLRVSVDQLCRGVNVMLRPERSPTRAELLDLLEQLDISLATWVGRWADSIPPEVRAEILLQAYEPVLRMLIRARRRPTPR